MRCSIQNCCNGTNKNHGITFHSFPKETSLKTLWTDALGTPKGEDRERRYICSDHFRNEDFYYTKSGMKKVKNGAVPFIEHNPEDLESSAALRVCRICLAIDTRLYDIREQKLDQYYQEITGIYVNDEDRLPQRLCWECAHRLRSAASFRGKALRAHSVLMESLYTYKTYITIKDIKAMNTIKNHLMTTLVQTNYDCNDSDLHIRDSEIIKTESHNHNEYNDNGFDDNDYNDSEFNDNYRNEPLVDVKAENEIFLNEKAFDGFESDDDKTLSVISSQIFDTDKVKIMFTDKKKVKVRVKKKKDVQKVKAKAVKKNEIKKSEEENPEVTMDKYKTSDVKRRKLNDGLDESLFTISTLTYEEQIEEIEKRQDSAAYKNAIFKCTTCYRGFQIRDRYEAHIVRHSEKCGMYECFICKSRLKAGRALRKHITSQHTEKFSCKGCPFVTRNRGVAREHQKWHAGTKYQCPHCAMEFDKLTTYMGHVRIKHVSDFVCALCGYTFVSQKGIDVHKRKKHRLTADNTPLEGPFCATCNVKFATDEAHERHLKLSSRHMTESDPNRLRNDSQSVNTEKNGRVMRRIERRPLVHARSPADPAQPPVTCEQCGVQLRDLRLYAQHFRRAHPDKNRTKYPAMKTPCMCELCGRIFQSMALLKDHMWVHTGEKRFKCSCCPKSFTQKSNLVFHERVHGDARPSFPCPLCGKHFAFYNNRRRHMFIHTGLKPFKCESCGKCFTTAGEQRAHIEHVHMKKPWPKRARRAEGWPDKCPEP